MRIVLDLRAGGWLGGRYYLQNLALALASLPAHERPTVFGLGPADEASEFNGLLERVTSPPPEADVIFPNWNMPLRSRIAQVHWIPDMQHRRMRGTFSAMERLKREYAFLRFALPARRIVVSSETVRRDAARAYPLIHGKLRVLKFRSCVPMSTLRASLGDTLALYGLEPGYVFLPNQFWKHKNHQVAFAAAERFKETLVCSGATHDSRDPQYFERVTSKIPPNVRIVGVVPRADYLQLVRGASVVLQPSRFEGWSSTVEDARAFGKPVVLSDIAVLREQAPENAWFFPPDDPDALVSAVDEAIASTATAEDAALMIQANRIAEYGRAFVALVREATG
jgi:glycosyltransferase involved in cell wall biosynthesis